MLAFVATPTVAFSMGASRPVSARQMQVQMMADYRIAPSILSANFAKLGEEVENVLAAGADVVHFDVRKPPRAPSPWITLLPCTLWRERTRASCSQWS